MLLMEAFQKGKIDRFEMMALAEEIFKLQQKNEQILSLDDVSFQEEGGFSFSKTFPLSSSRQKRILFLKQIRKYFGKRLASIFLNHFFAVDKEKTLLNFLEPISNPFLVACGGLSGSGKSRVAREMAAFIAPKWGCFIVRDDVVRKQMLSVPLSSNLGDTFYTPEYEKKVYSQMRREAQKMLQRGYPVILDALFYNPKERKMAEKLALDLKLPFVGLWLEAPLDVRAERVEKRKNNPSDVKTKEVLEEQLKKNLGQISWQKVYTHKEKDKTVQSAKRLLEKHLKKH